MRSPNHPGGRRRARARFAAAQPALGLALAACLGAPGGAACSLSSAGSAPAARASPSALPSPSAPPTAAANPNCSDATASFRPQGQLPRPGAMPDGSYMKRIQDRGRLIAGVSRDTLLFGYLNPLTNQLEGFDIDMVRQVARAIFGDDKRIEFRTITPAQRIPMLQDGSLDVVVRTFTVNCARWQQVAFSSVYYEAGQRVLVPRNSVVQGLQDLAGKKVCAPAGTTSIQNIANAPSRPVPVPVPDQTDCLVRLQMGEVDAISIDDTVLLGLAAQDPHVKVVGPRFSSEPYGIGIGQAHLDFVRFVNGVLEQMRADGTWTSQHNRWLGRFGPAPSPPAAKYRD